MTIYFHAGKRKFARITRDSLIAALQDPTLPDDYEIQPLDGYPGLAIISADEDRWYLGYIDLVDGEVVINAERGMDDGKNPFRRDGTGERGVSVQIVGAEA